ncbi:DUF5805 domain-containing protein [Halorubellus sp. PRR65]|uniref:DUF5805 domain-containing protein n=1 Tax=Halorubellus sp. PRR65 TaxID=3098148 RepID=UPI002B25D300|nr:DUF5805 domain-containing protein [Halorubellus sp. PRR65]
MSESDVERTVVKTYVPAYQKEAWVEHADRLDMSQSEFVRTMVQAGRRDFAVDGVPGVDDENSSADDDSTRATDASDGEERDDATGFEDRVYALLREETRSWDDLLEAVTDDVEGRLEDALQSLQAANKVAYSGRNGGYEAVEE